MGIPYHLHCLFLLPLRYTPSTTAWASKPSQPFVITFTTIHPISPSANHDSTINRKRRQRCTQRREGRRGAAGRTSALPCRGRNRDGQEQCAHQNERESGDGQGTQHDPPSRH